MSALQRIQEYSKHDIYSIYYCHDGFCNTFKVGNSGKILGKYDIKDVGNPQIHHEIISHSFHVPKQTQYIAFGDKCAFAIKEINKKILNKKLPWLNLDIERGYINDFLKFNYNEIALIPNGYYKNAIPLNQLNAKNTDLLKFQGLRIETSLATFFCKFPKSWPNLDKRKKKHLFFFEKYQLLFYQDWYFYFTSIKVRGQKSYSWYKTIFHENPELRFQQSFSTEFLVDGRYQLDYDQCGGYDISINAWPEQCREFLIKNQEVEVISMLNNKKNNQDQFIIDYYNTLTEDEQAEYEDEDDFLNIWRETTHNIQLNSQRHDLKTAPIVAYDTETCVHPMRGNIRPYLVHFYSETLDINESVSNECQLYCTCKWRRENCQTCKPGDVFDKAGDILVKIMLKAWEQKQNKLILVGFNNFKFDNSIFLGECIMKYLPLSLLLGKYQFGFNNFVIKNQESARNNKSNMWQTDVYFFDDNINPSTISSQAKFDNTFTIYVKDCVTFIPDKTLMQACEDYGVKMSKIDFDIVKANEIFETENKFVNEVEGQIPDFFKTKLLTADKLKLNRQFLTSSKKIKLADLTKYYCEMDTKATYELFKQVVDNVAKIIEITPRKNHILMDSCLYYLSIPNLAFEIFKELIEPTTETCVLKLPMDFRAKIEESCFGGRCDYSILGEYKTVKNLVYIDVTSEYPLAMLGYYPIFSSREDILIGSEVDILYYQNIIDSSYEIRQKHFEEKTLELPLPWHLPLSFFSCDFYPPCEARLITFGPIAYRQTDKLFYTNNSQTNRFLNSIQIRLLIYCGWKVKILPSKYNMVFLRREQIFKEFVDFTGKLKTDAREENKSLAKLLKLIMNSIAGKLGQRSFHDLKKAKYEFNSYSKCYTRNVTEMKNVDSKAQMHFLASFVWAYANQILYSTMFHLNRKLIYDGASLNEKTGALLYCDTDSIIYDKSMTFDFKFEISEHLGTFDTETLEFNATWKAKYTGFDNLIVACKKVYACVDNDKLLLKRAKGIHGKKADDECTLEYFRELLKEGKSKKIYIDTFKKVNSINDDGYTLHKLEHQKTEKRLNIRLDECFEIENHNQSNKELNKDVKFCISRIDDTSKQINYKPPLPDSDTVLNQIFGNRPNLRQERREFLKRQNDQERQNVRRRKRRRQHGNVEPERSSGLDA